MNGYENHRAELKFGSISAVLLTESDLLSSPRGEEQRALFPNSGW